MGKPTLIGHHVCPVQSAVKLGWVPSQGDELFCSILLHTLDSI